MVALGLCCCAGLSRVSASGLLSCDASLALEPRLQGARAAGVAAPGLESAGSGVAVRGCSSARGIVPGWGLNPCLLHWQVDPI